MRVYISGPMTGYPDLNRAAFRAAACRLRDLGHVPVDPSTAPEITGATWADYMRADIAEMVTCEAVAVLPGWEASRGAVLEVHIAHALGMAVLPIGLWRAAA